MITKVASGDLGNNRPFTKPNGTPVTDIQFYDSDVRNVLGKQTMESHIYVLKEEGHSERERWKN